MKYIVLCLLAIFSFIHSFPQDLIYKKNGTMVPVKIIRITPNEILYQASDSLKDLAFSVPILNVYMIRFGSGVEEIFGTGKRRRPETFFTDHKDIYYYSIAMGLGVSYGFLGVRFQGRIGGKQGLGYHAGIGVFPIDGTNQPARICYSAGFKFYFHKAWYAGLQIGRTVFPLSYDSTDYRYDTINYHAYHRKEGGPAIGLSFLAGGDWFLNKNFGFNGGFGFTFNLSEPSLDKMTAAVEFGIIYKFAVRSRQSAVSSQQSAVGTH